MENDFPLDVPEEVKKRIIKANYGQRSRMRKANQAIKKYNSQVPAHRQKSLIKIEDFDIIELFEEQDWICQCHRAAHYDGCFQRVDITKRHPHDDAPVVAHINNTANGGHHTRDNVGVMRHKCNSDICFTIEKGRAAKVASLNKKNTGFAPNGEPAKKKRKKKIANRPWGKGCKMQSRKGFR